MSALRDALSGALGRPVSALRQVAGGDLDDAYAAELDGGARVFVKTASDAAPGAFTREAEGLRWLAEPQAIAVAQVVAVADEPRGPRFLALTGSTAGRAARRPTSSSAAGLRRCTPRARRRSAARPISCSAR